MIIVEFEKSVSKKKRALMIDAIFFVDQELCHRLRKDYYINIRPVKNLSTKEGIYGDCMDEDDREFTIRIDISLSIEDIISTLMHEMVHVHQFITGKMRSKWVHEVTFDKVVYPHDMTYDERPWEIEAVLWEARLTERYSETKTAIRQGLFRHLRW
jgi:hypothetical protein|tara:strand:- start:850 stop:1317 length:468 start_codon:yes stop_codon:yes gene_type:complete